MTEQRVVILGEVRVEEIRDPGGVRESVDGDAVQLAAALRGHGLALTVVAPVAEDSDGEWIRSALQDLGVRLVAVPAPAGTLRRSMVRDRSGAEFGRQHGTGAFADTRRSLAAQADADVIVDLRDREVTTIAEERDQVLRALGLSADSERPADVVHAAASTPGAAPDPETAPAPAHRLLPAPIVAGTDRHGPVRLMPEAPAAPVPAQDWYGLEAGLGRIAT